MIEETINLSCEGIFVVRKTVQSLFDLFSANGNRLRIKNTPRAQPEPRTGCGFLLSCRVSSVKHANLDINL